MTERQPSPAEAARRQRCRSLELAAVLGIVLGMVSVVDRSWPGVAVGVAGAALAWAVWWRRCRDAPGAS